MYCYHNGVDNIIELRMTPREAVRMANVVSKLIKYDERAKEMISGLDSRTLYPEYKKYYDDELIPELIMLKGWYKALIGSNSKEVI